MQKIAIIEYGVSNLFSVKNALNHVKNDGDQIVLTNDSKVIANADKIVFPGQGAAKVCKTNLEQNNLIQTIKTCQQNPDQKFLGICMGMQVLMSGSDENDGVQLLNLVDGEVIKIDNTNNKSYKIPHMGWNHIKQQPHQLWHKIPDNSLFYFVHSYYCKPKQSSIITGSTTYCQEMTVALGNDNFFAIQSHPEKSGTDGLQLLNNFVNW